MEGEPGGPQGEGLVRVRPWRKEGPGPGSDEPRSARGRPGPGSDEARGPPRGEEGPGPGSDEPRSAPWKEADPVAMSHAVRPVEGRPWTR